MPGPRILIVDDELPSLDYIALALSAEFPEVRRAAGGHEALLSMEASLPDLVISDLHMPDPDGLSLLSLIKERWPDVPVIVVTVDDEIATVVEAVRRGAINYLPKPISPSALVSAANRALATSAARKSHDDRTVPEIVGSSPAMIRTRHLVALAARSDVNVLITGETGTGKELVARAIHRLSALARGPFVPHNCAVSPSELFESLFFGHRRGAFTGAERDQTGLLEEADGGILFLDELECLTLPHQAKLLRVLDDGWVQPVGSVEHRLVSVRFLSATNRDPLSMLSQGTLREDLYYRLRGIVIALPPLRERRLDIAALSDHFLAGTRARLSESSREVLGSHFWPGNVRQLRNTLRGALAAAPSGQIDPAHLALPSASEWSGDARAALSAESPITETGRDRTLRDLERQALLQALRDSGGRRADAARALGIHRSTLRRKMRELHIGGRSH
jgi:DNA-binding NtrC family response regulator